MGFFDALTGKAQSKAIAQANANAKSYLNQGYDAARGNITTADTQAQGYLQGGYDRAIAASGAGLTQARGDLDPYAQAGNRALAQYQNALGLNGRGQQQQFYDQYAAADPFRAYNERQATTALARQYNARGMSNSGLAALASARASQDRGSQDFSAYMNRLQGLAGQGQQAAGQQSGYSFNNGQQVAQYGYNLGSGQAQIAQNTGQSLAGLNTGQYNALAGNEINYGNARAQASSIGINNLAGLGGLALKAAATAYGVPSGGAEALPWHPNSQARWG